jgi:hypothetical protein
MKKSIIIGSLALFCNTLFAAPLPNIWTTGFGQGWLEYNISNENKQSLRISCNVGYDDETDHGIVFTSDSKDYAGEDLAFIMDGNAYYPLLRASRAHHGQSVYRTRC